MTLTKRSYLDFNATAPSRPEVIDAVVTSMRRWGNASSVHKDGRVARSCVEKAREQVAALVGGSTKNVIFTGSGTEANNHALRSVDAERLIVSAIEHESIINIRKDIVICPVRENGILDLGALEQLLSDSKKQTTVSIMFANNETGIIQPVKEVARLTQKFGAFFHCDAVQAVGKIPVNFESLGADSLAISAHKIGGPQGVGALVCRNLKNISSFIHGGGQESGLRGGTENVPGIVGYGVAADAALSGLPSFSNLAKLRNAMECRVLKIKPDAMVFGRDLNRLPNTSKFATKGLKSEVQVVGLDLDGISISAGSACSSGRIETPYVLAAMGVPEELGRCAIRVSLGWTTTGDDIDRFIASWKSLCDRKLVNN